MEEDEIEMTKEELQKWIRERIQKIGLISPDVMEKCSLLQSLLEMREKQADNLLKLCESVTACEAIVKKQYSVLGWEYRDTDSDDDDNSKSCENPPATNGRSPLSPKRQDGVHLNQDDVKKSSVSLKRQLVVVLTRLPKSQIAALCLPAPQNQYGQRETDSDTEWEPEDYATDSDYSHSSCTSREAKRRKIDQNNERPAMSTTTKTSEPNARANTVAKSNATKTSTPQANVKPDANSNAMKTSTLHASISTDSKSSTTSTPQGNENTKSNTTKSSSSLPAKADGEKITVGMNVLARKKAMSWQLGKIIEIVEKEDGSLKYKISFEEKRKRLVSGHHIAFHLLPKLEQLYVGARVVVRCQENELLFRPGILAELPSRKNRARFLVFIDDHTPVYVGLPLLHLVCRPLTDASDDIPDGLHKDFIKMYIKDWPYPHLTQYKVGQRLNAELNGVQQRCEVQLVDCSIIQVVFQTQGDPQQAWIHRGSTRLEQVTRILEWKRKEAHKDKKPTDTVNMEEDEIEMTKEELQKWIRERVKIKLISPDVMEKYNLLQSLLERREKQADNLLKLHEKPSGY